MRVLLISSSSGSRGGGEFYFQALASGLVDLGHHVEFGMSDADHMDEFAATMDSICQVIRLPITNTYLRKTRILGAVRDGRSRSRFASFLRSSDADVVHLNKQNLEDGLELVLGMKDAGLPALATIHVTRTMQRLGAAMGSVRDRIARRSLQRAGIPLVGTSARCTQELQAFVGQSITCFNIPNGAFEAVGDRKQSRDTWGMQDEDIVLGVVARIEAQKNPLFLPGLLEALPKHVKLVWIGDGSLREQLEQALADRAVADRVRLVGWQSNARAQMPGFDIFVLPSIYEGFPFAILEAMSTGLPCVVSDVDGTRDSIEHGETGFLCSVNDLENWRSTLLELVESDSQRKQIGQSARNRYESEFSIKAMADRTVAVYEKLITETS